MEPWRVLDDAAPDAARAMLLRCCGSSRWVEQMLAERPFGSHDALLTKARSVWLGLERADWLEAFAHHPRIGEGRSAQPSSKESRELSAQEQRLVSQADANVRDAIATGNREYEMKFGYIFIICASGRPAESILAALRERLAHDAATELPIAAEEQARITALRLQSLT